MPAQPHERAAVVSTIDPANLNNNTSTGDAVDMSKFRSAMFILALGANDSTVDFKLTECATSGGSYTDITGKAITQETGGDEDNLQFVICVRAEELSSGMRYVKPSVTVGNGTTNLGCVIGLGLEPRYGPASDDDLSSVDQIIV
ncbi:MAG: hypothetical protein U0840_03910 [Gemmataceae bacterium]